MNVDVTVWRGVLSADLARPRRRRLGRHWRRLVWFAAWGALALLALGYAMFCVYGAAMIQGAGEAMGLQ